MTIRFAERLLTLAAALCGDETARRVFEPLVADWDRERRDARGARRLVVIASGICAFGWTLLRCMSLARTVSAIPLTGFAVVVLLFAASGIVLMQQPMQYYWIGVAPKFQWSPIGFAGFRLAILSSLALAYALLPATMLASFAGWSLRKTVAAVAITISIILVFEGWIAPAVADARQRAFLARLPRAARFYDPRRYANMVDTIALTRDSDPQVAGAARRRLRTALSPVVMAISFAFLGVALGRTRVKSSLAPRLIALTGWWLFAWIAFHALNYWGQFLLMMVGLPRNFSGWVAPMTFFLLSAAAILASRYSRLNTIPAV